jgi:hypothetical protein
MAESRDAKRRKKPDGDPSHGLKRDTRRDTRKRFGLKITTQYKSNQGFLTKAHSWTKWYETADQRDEALRTEKAKGSHGWGSMQEIRSFETVER